LYLRERAAAVAVAPSLKSPEELPSLKAIWRLKRPLMGFTTDLVN
jgi:hypothetical protein